MPPHWGRGRFDLVSAPASYSHELHSHPQPGLRFEPRRRGLHETRPSRRWSRHWQGKALVMYSLLLSWSHRMFKGLVERPARV